MLKSIETRPNWLKSGRITDIYCIGTEDFANYIPYWRHNGYWLFDNPEIIYQVSALAHINTAGMTLFYYEVFEEEFEESSRRWRTFEPEQSFQLDVKKPATRNLEGFDVVTFESGNAPEYSPLYCNSLAIELPVNSHCLFKLFDDAVHALETGKFDASEPGPFRIFAVYTVERGD